MVDEDTITEDTITSEDMMPTDQGKMTPSEARRKGLDRLQEDDEHHHHGGNAPSGFSAQTNEAPGPEDAGVRGGRSRGGGKGPGNGGTTNSRSVDAK
jgi:hypothetical protein